MMTAQILRTRTFRAAVTLGVVVAAGLATAATAQSAPVSADATQTATTQADAGRAGTPVPDILVPPAGNTEVAQFKAAGVQIYQCTAGAWVFLEPAASLTGFETATHRPSQAIHFRGPSWESLTDGSLVEAKSIASSPVEGTIPQLLLQATRNRGDGVFGKVTYVQRLNTRGGAAPTTTCTDGATQSVHYTADYHFFAPAAA